MGGLVIETVRPGVQFVPDAAAAFRRADAQVMEEFERPIDVNSTYRSWSDQMVMFEDWSRYVNGTDPRPAHSKAVHPSESFHVQGVALDSDDWRVPRIVAILAENGFIRNRLYVKGEDHHFEYIRARDKNYGKEVDDVSATEVWNTPVKRGGKNVPALQELADTKSNTMVIKDALAPVIRSGEPVSVRQEIADAKTNTIHILAEVRALSAAVQALAVAKGADPAAILRAVQDGVEKAMRKVTVTVDVDG